MLVDYHNVLLQTVLPGNTQRADRVGDELGVVLLLELTRR